MYLSPCSNWLLHGRSALCCSFRSMLHHHVLIGSCQEVLCMLAALSVAGCVGVCHPAASPAAQYQQSGRASCTALVRHSGSCCICNRYTTSHLAYWCHTCTITCESSITCQIQGSRQSPTVFCGDSLLYFMGIMLHGCLQLVVDAFEY